MLLYSTSLIVMLSYQDHHNLALRPFIASSLSEVHDNLVLWVRISAFLSL